MGEKVQMNWEFIGEDNGNERRCRAKSNHHDMHVALMTVKA